MDELQLKRIADALERVAIALEKQSPPPSFQASLESFPSYDWALIGATVDARDDDGVAVVSYRGNSYSRRSAANKFEPAIWFSRAVGKGEDGEPKYERLITFKRYAEVEALPKKTVELLPKRSPTPVSSAQPQAIAQDPLDRDRILDEIGQHCKTLGWTSQEAVNWLQGNFSKQKRADLSDQEAAIALADLQNKVARMS